MASIDDFIKHRWEDAKEALRGLDGEFVSKLESQCRLESLGLRMPRLYSVAQKKAHATALHGVAPSLGIMYGVKYADAERTGGSQRRDLRSQL